MADSLKYHEQQEGWKHEYLYDGKCICFERPREIGGGFVTVDMDRRIFFPGYGFVPRAATETKYEGRGWKDRIIRDAIDYLEKTMTETFPSDPEKQA